MNAVAVGLPPRLHPLDPVLLDNPYPTYARLRRASALCRGGPATWAVMRYAEVAALLRDPRVGHEFPDEFQRPFTQVGGQPNLELPRIVSALEPPQHTRIRNLISKALSPAVIRRMSGRIRQRADQLLDVALDRGEMDAFADLALPLQVSVACELVGVPERDRAAVSRHAMDLGRALILIPFVSEVRGNGEAEARWLREYVTRLVAERERRPRTDLVSRLLTVRRDGDRLTADEIVDNVVFLFFAGFETSIHLVANGCAALLRFPDQLARLRADRSLIPSAVEEILRYDAPIQWIARMTAAPVDIGGRTVKRGRVLLLVLASANHDDRRFAHPEQLDVARQPNPHLSFGGGIHHCLGVVLARTQGAIVFDRLLERCAALEAAGPPVLRAHPNLRGYSRVPVMVRAA
jgi:cytochrome P450